MHVGTLNINHPVQVLRAIWDGRTVWRAIGLELGLSHDVIEAISTENPLSVDDCFYEMISKWLRSACRPNWESLISALRSPLVGREALAVELAESGKVSAFLSLSLS